MTHDSSCLVLDRSPTFFVSSGYKIRRTFQIALLTFIRDERPVSIPASRVCGFQMLAKFLKRSQAQHFFSLVVFEKLSRNVSTKMSWFQCTLWYGLVQLTISNKAKVAVEVERDAFALMEFPVVILLVEFCTDPQSCFLAVWFFAIELPKLFLKFSIIQWNMAYSCSRTALVQSGYGRYNLDRDWMLLHVLWLQPSDVCAVFDWSFARWITFICWLPFLHVVPRLLQGFAFLPSVFLPNKRFVLDPSNPAAQNDEKISLNIQCWSKWQYSGSR